MRVWVGIYECTLRIIGASSLKEKRRVLKSILTKVRNRFNLSVAEIDHQNQWQLSKIAFAGVGSQKKVVEQELQKARYIIESNVECEIMDDQIIFV